MSTSCLRSRLSSCVVRGRGMRWIRRLNLAVALLSLAILCTCLGCVFTRLKQDRKAAQESLATLKGDVISAMTESDLIFVVLWDADHADRSAMWHWPMYRPGEFDFAIPAPGRYRLLAFKDRNRDCVFQDNEPAAFYQDGAAVVVSPGQELTDLRIWLAEDDRVPLDFRVDLSSQAEVVTFEGLAIGYGEVRDVNDPHFTQANANMGLWEPLRFLKEVGMGIYFLEAFDPSKTPILFVHGLSGHPGQWDSIIKRIDRDNFQPWLFY